MSAANNGETTPGQQQPHHPPGDAPRAMDTDPQQAVCGPTRRQLDAYVISVPESDKSHVSTIAALESALASVEEARRVAVVDPPLMTCVAELKRAATACQRAAKQQADTGGGMNKLENEIFQMANQIEIATVHLNASLRGGWTDIARLAESVRLIRTVQFISDMGAAVLFINIEREASSLGHRLFDDPDLEAPSDGSDVDRLERQVYAVVNAATQRSSVLVRIECTIGERSGTGDLPLLPITDAPAEICIDGKWRRLREYWLDDVGAPDVSDVFQPILYVIGKNPRNEPVWNTVRTVLNLRGKKVMKRNLKSGERAKNYLVGECLLATRPKTSNGD